MKSLAKNKGTILAVVIFALLMSVYNFFKADLVPLVTPSEPVGSDLVELFADLQSVSLDQSFLSSPLYTSLIDSNIELLPQPKGRPNPFNPIGRD